MSVRSIAMDDMRKAGLDCSVFLYDFSGFDGRMFNGNNYENERRKNNAVSSKDRK